MDDTYLMRMFQVQVQAPNPEIKYYVMHEKADKPVATGIGSVITFASETSAEAEAQRLASMDRDGASYYVLKRVLKVAPVARTTTTRL